MFKKIVCKLPCIKFFSRKRLYLFSISFLFLQPSFSDFDGAINRDFEQRMHEIYESSYSKPVLASTWFQFVESIEEQSYDVRQGDTLWGISEIYFGDGFYWSKLWAVNQTITNPHQIHVGDTIYFRTGNFKKAPEIKVEEGDPELEQLFAGSEEESVEVITPVAKSNQISPLFKETAANNQSETSDVFVEKRPEIIFDRRFVLSKELLEDRPNVVGNVVGLGRDREISGVGKELLVSSYDDIAEGAIYSVVNVQSLAGGYEVNIVGLIQIGNRQESGVYKAKIVKQFDGILKGYKVSSYVPKMIDNSLSDEVVSRDFDLIPTRGRSLWGEGEVVFLRSQEDQLNAGEIVRVKNQFQRGYDSLVMAGLLKIVSSSGEYATALVVSSQQELTKKSLSR